MRLRLFLLALLSGSTLLAQTPADPPTATPPVPLPPGEVPPPSVPPPGPQSPSGAQPAPGPASAAPPVAAKSDKKPSVVRVNVTNQAWDFIRPWGKHQPYSRRAVGAVLADKRVLVTGELVGNANYVEFEAPDGGLKVAASIEIVDYEANLAILKADDPKFMEAFGPVEFTTATVGDTLSIWQLESTGTLLVTKGSMTTAEVTPYPIDGSPLLVYRATASLQFRDSSFTLPVVKDDKLVGLIARYDNNTKSAEIVPTPVIEHFLKDAAKPPYQGFARAGLAFSITRDPQLRRYVGLGNAAGGVYVTDVLPGGPAEKAGIAKGDIVLSIDGEAIDQDGNYTDPNYGKISLTHLVGTRHFVGDELKFAVIRKGERKELPVTISHRPANEFVIEPYVMDRAPQFYVLGGLVLQELSRQFLKEWGSDWVKKAPEEFVFLDRQQAELFPDAGKKVVILSAVLPSHLTLGYEELHQMIVKKINGVPLDHLSDVPAALAKSTNGLHKIEFDGDPSAIYLDASAIGAGDRELMQNYRIPTLKRLE